MDLDKYFVKSELIPAIIQEKSTGEVLMLAYMNRESMQKTFETGYTWFCGQEAVRSFGTRVQHQVIYKR